MEYTQYFIHTRKMPDWAYIKDEWIEDAINNPIRSEVQSDGRIKKWAKDEDVNKYLYVILLKDGETVHNAFFDRKFKEEVS